MKSLKFQRSRQRRKLTEENKMEIHHVGVLYISFDRLIHHIYMFCVWGEKSGNPVCLHNNKAQLLVYLSSNYTGSLTVMCNYRGSAQHTHILHQLYYILTSHLGHNNKIYTNKMILLYFILWTELKENDLSSMPEILILWSEIKWKPCCTKRKECYLQYEYIL